MSYVKTKKSKKKSKKANPLRYMSMLKASVHRCEELNTRGGESIDVIHREFAVYQSINPLPVLFDEDTELYEIDYLALEKKFSSVIESYTSSVRPGYIPHSDSDKEDVKRLRKRASEDLEYVVFGFPTFFRGASYTFFSVQKERLKRMALWIGGCISQAIQMQMECFEVYFLAGIDRIYYTKDEELEEIKGAARSNMELIEKGEEFNLKGEYSGNIPVMRSSQLVEAFPMNYPPKPEPGEYMKVALLNLGISVDVAGLKDPEFMAKVTKVAHAIQRK